MDNFKYVHGLVFEKQSINSDIKYVSSITLPIINRKIKVSFKYDVDNVNEQLVNFASNYQNFIEELTTILINDANNYLSKIDYSKDEELLELANITKKYDIYKFISYNELIITNDGVTISCRVEWDFKHITYVNYNNNVIMITRNDIDIVLVECLSVIDIKQNY